MSLILANTQISVWPGLIFSSGWNWPLMVNCTSRSFSGSAGFAGDVLRRAVNVCRFCGMNWFCPRCLRIDSGPAYQLRDVLGTLRGFGEVHRRQARLIRSVGELVALRRLQRADALRPVGLFSWWPLPLRSKTKLYCNRHVADGNVVLRDQGQVAVGSADLQQPGQAHVGLLRGHRVAMAVVPVQAVGHVLRHGVVVGVAHPGRNRQQHVVGVARRADVQSVGVQVQRRFPQHGRVDRDFAACGNVRRSR